MAPVHGIQRVSEDIVESTNLALASQTFTLPVLQHGPNASSTGLMNFDMNSHPAIQRTVRDALHVRHTMLSEVTDMSFLLRYSESEYDENSPRSAIIEPVFETFLEDAPIVGIIIAVEAWATYFEKSLPKEIEGFVVDVHDSCESEMTFVIDNGNVEFQGHEDLHDRRYNYLAQRAEFATFARYDGEEDGARHCDYTLIVYPSRTFESTFHTNQPYLFASVLVAVFAVTCSVFATYDWMVRRRQNKVVDAAKRTTAIVHSLFPKSVGDRLIAAENEKADRKHQKRKDKLETFMSPDDFGKEEQIESEPIADFVTGTTIVSFVNDMMGLFRFLSSCPVLLQ